MGSLSASQARSFSNAFSSSQPWVQQQPFLSDIYGQARDLYNQGGTPYYPGQTYASFNPEQRQYFTDATANRYGTALEQSLIRSLMQRLGGGTSRVAIGRGGGVIRPAGGGNAKVTAVGGGGVPVPTRGGATTRENLHAIANKLPFGHALIPAYNTGLSPTGQAGRSRSELAATATGQRFKNPFLDDAYDRAAEAITRQYSEVARPQTNIRFARAGRSGSGLHQLANERNFEDYIRQQSDLAGTIYGGAYERERQNQLDAARYLASEGSDRSRWAAELAQRGLEHAAGVGDRRYEYDAGRGDRGYEFAAGLVPTLGGLYDSRMDRYRDVGERIYDLSQMIRDDDVARFRHTQGQPWEQLARYANIILGQLATQSESQSSGKSKSGSFGLAVGG